MKLFERGLELTETEEKLLLNDLIDIEEWIINALKGKVDNCKKRFIEEWYTKLMNNPKIKSLPTNLDDFVKLVTSLPEYKNRKERDIENK